MLKRIIFLVFAFCLLHVPMAQDQAPLLTPEGTWEQTYIGYPILKSQGTFDSELSDVSERGSSLEKTVSIRRVVPCEKTSRYEAGNRDSMVYMGTWDLDGSGKGQKVFNHGSYIQVLQNDGSSRNYTIAEKWALMVSAIGDLDGDEGAELPFNTGSYIKVIKDKNRTVRDYAIASGSWALMSAIDTDGEAGNELICNAGAYVKIIHHKTGQMQEYPASSGSWALLSGGLSDFDGAPGSEVALNIGGGIKIITDRKGQSHEYSIGIPWALAGIKDHDEIAGSEILYRRSGLWAICHRKHNTYFVNSREEACSHLGEAESDHAHEPSHQSQRGCPKCDGSGLMPVLCPHFKRFVIKCTEGCHSVTCETCAGSGAMPPSSIGCPRCKGRGMIGQCMMHGYVLWCSDGASWYICSTCDKRGVVDSTFMACPRCHGFGEISYCNSCGSKFLLSCSHGIKWTGCGACAKGLIANQFFSCPRCRGYGEYRYCNSCQAEVLTCSHNSIFNYHVCGTCNKTGRMSFQFKVCPVCNGNGKYGANACIVCSGKGVIENISKE